jgi:hypothetical protein
VFIKVLFVVMFKIMTWFSTYKMSDFDTDIKLFDAVTIIGIVATVFGV